MIDALKYVTTLAGLKYRIESSAVMILPLDAPEGEMVTRSYPVTPGVFKTIGGGPEAAAPTTPQGAVGSYRSIGDTGIAAATVTTNDVEGTFRACGVPFPPGSSLVFNSRTSTIIIRNTPGEPRDFRARVVGLQLRPVPNRDRGEVRANLPK